MLLGTGFTVKLYSIFCSVLCGIILCINNERGFLNSLPCVIGDTREASTCFYFESYTPKRKLFILRSLVLLSFRSALCWDRTIRTRKPGGRWTYLELKRNCHAGCRGMEESSAVGGPGSDAGVKRGYFYWLTTSQERKLFDQNTRSGPESVHLSCGNVERTVSEFASVIQRHFGG